MKQRMDGGCMSRTTQGGMLAHLGLLGVALMTTVLAASSQSQQSSGARLFVGSRLIVGDGSSIENSAFVVENGKITKVGRNGEVQAPPGAARIDLAGKTVMPTLVNDHLHLGYEGYTSWSGENYTRDNVVTTLARLAYYGVGAVISTGTDPTSSPSGCSGISRPERLAEPGIYSPPERRRPERWSKRRLPQRSQVQRSPTIYDLPERDRGEKGRRTAGPPKASSSSRSGSTTGTAGSPSCSQTCMARSSTKLTNTTSRSSRTRRTRAIRRSC
jgi:hypothetical protein